MARYGGGGKTTVESCRSIDVRDWRWSSPRTDHSGSGPFYPKAPVGTDNYGAIMPAIEPLALSPRDFAAYRSISKLPVPPDRSPVDVASLKAYYEEPIVFGRGAHVLPHSRQPP